MTRTEQFQIESSLKKGKHRTSMTEFLLYENVPDRAKSGGW